MEKSQNEVIETFIYGAAHEFREPLRKICIYSQMLLLQADLPEPVRQFLEEIYQAGLRTERLLDDLLQFANAQRGSTAAEEIVDLNIALAQARAELSGEIGRSGASLEMTPLSTRVRGAKASLVWVFRNLVGNAIKYAREGTRPAITITGFEKGEYATVRIKDEGIGFHPDYAEWIFAPFKRLKMNAAPGSGLGLALVKTIVTTFGGSIRAESDETGTTFTISLPVAADSPSAGFPERRPVASETEPSHSGDRQRAKAAGGEI